MTGIMQRGIRKARDSIYLPLVGLVLYLIREGKSDLSDFTQSSQNLFVHLAPNNLDAMVFSHSQNPRKPK